MDISQHPYVLELLDKAVEVKTRLACLRTADEVEDILDELEEKRMYVENEA